MGDIFNLDNKFFQTLGKGVDCVCSVSYTHLTVEFGGLFGYAPIMPVNKYSCDDFINRTGRIPAPIHSFKKDVYKRQVWKC